MEKRDFDIIRKGISNWNMYRNSTIMVTGATGRIGRFILETIVDADLKYNLNLRVVGLARNHEKAVEVFGDLLEFPNVSFLYQDVNQSIEYDGNMDFIFHTAGPAAPLDFKTSAVNVLWAHVNGTHNVLEFAVNHATKKVFYVSTVEIYGTWESDETIKEEDMGPLKNLNSRACYPEAKRLCETMLASYKECYGIDFCGVRLCHTLAAGILLNDGRAFAEFINCALNGKDIILHSNGSAMRTYTYTPDAVNAIFMIMERGESGYMYNVAANENLISIRDLANLIADLSPKKKSKVIFSEEASKMPYLPFKLAIMDTSKIRALGWAPQADIEKTFKWTIESFL
nr:NAD-dependent epimerase/dehydratase family protein [uncultured Prevotella sp.]